MLSQHDAVLLGQACARLGRAALILPGVTGTKELGFHYHCVMGRYCLRLAVQLVRLIGSDIRAVYRAEALCVAAPHLQPLWNIDSGPIELHTDKVAGVAMPTSVKSDCNVLLACV